MSITEHDSLSYSTGIRPDGGAKQGWGGLGGGGAVSVSLLALEVDWSWTGHTAVPGRSAPDIQASNKSACDG